MRRSGRSLSAPLLALLAAGLAPQRPAIGAQAPCPAELPPCRVDASELPPQEADCDYAPPAPPALPRCGEPRPEVAVDAWHHNVYRARGLYWPFAKLLSAHGFAVRDSVVPLDELLVRARPRILVVAGADEPPSPAETRAVVGWVERGGGLLLVLDHAPHDAALDLLAAFLPEVAARERTHGGQAGSPGATAPSTLFLPARSPGLEEHTAVLLDRPAPSADGSDGPILDGVARVETYGGIALLPCPAFRPGDPDACAPRPPAWSPLQALAPILAFLPGARTEDGQDLSDHLQGLAFRWGAGRVYVSGEGAMFTAQRQYHFGPPAGYGTWGLRDPDNDNARLLLGIVHWLAGAPAATPDAGGGSWKPSGARSRSSAWSSSRWASCSG